MGGITRTQVLEIAARCGFELAGIAAAAPAPDFARFDTWRAAGMAGEMTYLTDRRGDLRADPRNLLPSAKTLLCVGKLYNTSHPYSTSTGLAGRGWISRYAWGADYHAVVREALERVVEQIRAAAGEPVEARVCVDTAPLLERSYARLAGLGWIGRNTCLINQQQGSWFFLGEVLLDLDLDPDQPPPDRCGTCTRCIDACPTAAIVPGAAEGEFRLDARRCISYWTIEQRGDWDDEQKRGAGPHIFGCDICQEVCPWNRKAPVTTEPAFAPRWFAPRLDDLARLAGHQFRQYFRRSPVLRAKHTGLQRNVAAAQENDRAAHPPRAGDGQ